MSSNNATIIGSGGDAVGLAVAFASWGPWFEYHDIDSTNFKWDTSELGGSC